MNKVKKFVEDHQKEIIVGSCIAGAVVGGLLVRHHLKSKFAMIPRRLDIIAWDPRNGTPFTLENVIEQMGELKDSNRMYAVRRDGANYSLIMLTRV